MLLALITHDLNVCWNIVYRTVLNFNRWESVKRFINGLGKLNLHYILKVHNFITTCYVATLFVDLFWLNFKDCFHKDDWLRYASKPQHVAISSLYKQFNNDCVCWLFSSCCVFYCLLDISCVLISAGYRDGCYSNIS